jgi:predicted dehydrogenase
MGGCPGGGDASPIDRRAMKVEPRKIKAAIIGCGQISEAHLSEIGLIEDAEVVGVCDLQEILAQDAAERFKVGSFYADYRRMIDETKPDVVHLTTPAHTHLPIGIDILRRGCHAYVEKPFGINFEQANELIDEARRNGRLVCGGFSQWYDRVAVLFRSVINDKRIGDVVHFESYYGNSLDGNFAKLLLRDKEHWVNQLPGGMFHNIVSHALYHVVPLLPAPIEKIFCISYNRSGNGAVADELRVLLKSKGVTGYVTIACGVRPITQLLRVYGSAGIAELDLANHLYSERRQSALPGFLGRLQTAFSTGSHFIREGLRTGYLAGTGKDRFFAGMGRLFQEFYESIREGRAEPPVPYEVVLNVAQATDAINDHLQNSQVEGV